MNFLTNELNTIVLKSIELPKMTIKLCSDGIVHCKYIDDVVVFRHDVNFGVEKRIEIFGEESRPFIIDITNLKGISNDASRFFASEQGTHQINSVAIYYDDEDGEILAEEFIKEFKVPYPIEAFSNYSEACLWLLDTADL